jgi:hypothetical protein
MLEDRDEIDRFVADVNKADPRASWKQISERCKERFPNAQGISLTPNALRKRYNVWLKESKSSQPPEYNKESRMIAVQDKDRLLQELMEGLEDLIEDHVRGIIERVSAQVAHRVFDEKFSNLQTVPANGRSEGPGCPPSPPLPETVKGTRRHAIQRVKIAGTVDSNLLDLFEKERKERGYNTSRMLDVVLWNYFSIGRPNKPQMSFELSEPSDT